MGYQVHFPLMVKLIAAGLAERLVMVGPKRGKAKLPFKVPTGSHRIGPPEGQTGTQAPTVITVLVPDITDVVTAGKNRETNKRIAKALTKPIADPGKNCQVLEFSIVTLAVNERIVLNRKMKRILLVQSHTKLRIKITRNKTKDISPCRIKLPEALRAA